MTDNALHVTEKFLFPHQEWYVTHGFSSLENSLSYVFCCGSSICGFVCAEFLSTRGLGW